MKRIIHKRVAVLIVCLILLLCATIGGTLAYVFTKTPTVENTFTPAQVSCAVVETFESNVKQNVRVQNTGDATAYIRLTVVVTWKYQDANGIDHVYAQTPIKGQDYAIEYATNTQWLQGNDGFWYYCIPVPCAKDASSETETLTQVLINSVQQLESAMIPEGYALSVEIIASAIQSYPSSAVTENWHVTVDQNGVITAVNAGGEAA